jgi:spore germination protein
VIVLTVYVVKPKDSIYSIAKANGITPESIISANRLVNPSQLVIGQALVLPTSSRAYTVKSGDTIYSIARANGVSQNAIFSANPHIGSNGVIYAGQVLTIPSGEQKLGTIEVNGYIFPGSNEQIVRDAFPSLTYLSIFSYQVKEDGSLVTIEDEKWIRMARQNNVAPIMVVTNIRATGGFSSDITDALLTNMAVQQTLINNIVTTMKQKNYYGLNIDFEYIFPKDRESYNQFLRTITARMHELGYIVLTAVAPKNSAEQKGLLYEAHDYPAHGEIVDRVILMTYEWGYLAGPPQAVAPLNLVRRVLDYAVSVIPRDKILMGIPNYGYDWVLPYVRGTRASTFSNIEAINRAFRNNAEIRYDETAQSPYYNYYDDQKRQHIVWFEDARSIRQKLLLVDEYKLAGVSYWTIERPFPQNLLLINSMFTVKKVV